MGVLTLGSFLKEMIKFDKIEEIGGPFNSTEHFAVKTTTDSEGNKVSVLSLRGKEHPIDEQRLQELVEINRNLHKQETE